MLNRSDDRWMIGAVQIIDKVDDLQIFKKAARQGDKPANEGVYTDVNDRNLQVQSTKQAVFSAIGRENRGCGLF